MIDSHGFRCHNLLHHSLRTDAHPSSEATPTSSDEKYSEQWFSVLDKWYDFSSGIILQTLKKAVENLETQIFFVCLPLRPIW